jgi:hypothetical protein
VRARAATRPATRDGAAARRGSPHVGWRPPSPRYVATAWVDAGRWPAAAQPREPLPERSRAMYPPGHAQCNREGSIDGVRHQPSDRYDATDNRTSDRSLMIDRHSARYATSIECCKHVLVVLDEKSVGSAVDTSELNSILHRPMRCNHYDSLLERPCDSRHRASSVRKSLHAGPCGPSVGRRSISRGSLRGVADG